MAAHCYYELKIFIVGKRGKKTEVASCDYEDNKYNGALKNPDVKKQLSTISNGEELIRVIESGYKSDNDNGCTVDWKGKKELQDYVDFSTYSGIVLIEETHDMLGGERTTRKTIKLTSSTNKNFYHSNAKKKKAPSDAEKPVEEPAKETVSATTFDGKFIVVRQVKKGERKKVYGRTVADMYAVIARALKIEATEAQFQYLLRSIDEGERRALAFRYLTKQVELSDDCKSEMDKVIKKQRKKLYQLLISEGNVPAVEYIIGLYKRVPTEEVEQLLELARQKKQTAITDCLECYKMKSEQ